MTVRKILHSFVLVILIIAPMLFTTSIDKVNAAGIDIPTPREETFIFMDGTAWDSNQNPLAEPYANYMILTQQQAEFFWYQNYATGETVFWLATGFEYSSDYMTFTIHLRDGVEWNDGMPFTSKDVKFTLDLIKSNELLENHGWVVEWIDSVSTPDNLTVVLSLNSPNPRVDQKLKATNWGGVIIVPEHIWKDVQNPQQADTWGRGPVPVANVYTGPYVLESFSQESMMIVLKRNENYWGKKIGVFPEPKYVIHRDGRSSDLEYREIVDGGAYDGGFATWMPRDLLTTAITVGPNVTSVTYSDLGNFYLFVNCAKYPLNMSQVRWAISYAFERETFCTACPWYPGLSPATYPWSSWGSMDKFDYPDVFGTYKLEYNLTKAAEILDNLGFIDRNADGIRETPNGTRLSWEIMIGYDGETFTPLFVSLIDDFASIGVEIRLSAQGYNIITDRTSVGDYDLWWDNPHNGAVLSLLSSEIEPLLDMYQDKYYVPIGEPLPEYDYVRATRFKNPEVNTLASQMSQISPTDPAMEPLEHRAVEIFMEQLPSIPIAQFRRISVFSERYWTGYPTEDNFYVLPHESMCEYRFIIDTIQPTGYIPPFTDVTYVYVWFVADVETFRGADGANYGPYGNGEFVRIPETDANRLIAAGSATTQPSEIPGIGQILQAITSLATSTSTGFDDIRESLNNQLNTLTAGLIIEAIAIIVLIALVAVMLLKRSK